MFPKALACLKETLKFISNEYLEAFEKKLRKAGDNPANKIAAIIDNDFDKKICNQEKIAVWYTFFSEVKFKPVYLQICKERDEYYNRTVINIIHKLIKHTLIFSLPNWGIRMFY